MNNDNFLSYKYEIIEKAKTSKKTPSLFTSLFLSIIGFNLLASFLLLIPLLFLSPLMSGFRGAIGESLNFSINNLILPFGAIAITCFLWVKLREKRSISSLGFTKNNFLKKYSIGFLLGIAMIGLCSLVFYILGFVKYNPTGDYSSVGLSAISGVLILLIGWIIQGATEEILVRGWLMPSIAVKYNLPLAIIISSCLFGALHLLNSNISVISIINLILFGGFAALYVLKEGDLWGICGLHSSWNWAQGNLFGFEVSGINPVGGALIPLKESGPDFITGGLFGPEGGIVVTIILVIGITILKIMLEKKTKEIKD